MKKLKLHRILAGIFARTAILLSSCSDITENESEAAVKSENLIKIVLADENESDARTILPTFTKGDLTNITLYGLKGSSGTLKADSNKLKTWETYADLSKDSGVITDSSGFSIEGNWNFLLTAESNGAAMEGESGEVNVSGTTEVKFTLAVSSSATTGKVKVELAELDDFDISSVKYYWSSSQESVSTAKTAAVALDVTLDSEGKKNAVFEKEDVSKGSYWITFFFYNTDGELVVQPWQSSVIVQAGALSYKKLTPSTLSATTYNNIA